MEENNIRKYAKLMEELGLTGLEIGENGCSVRLERNLTQLTQVMKASPAAAPEYPPPAAADENIYEVLSPMVGVFYSSPTENSESYVTHGQRIEKGSVLCIIEAMKLMNEIIAEYSGTVEEICVGNNQIVDFHHVLFRIRKEH